MEQLTYNKTYLKKFTIKKVSKEKSLADEIFEGFGRRINYGVIMKLIKEKGWQFVQETFTQTKRAEAENQAGLFLSIVGQQRILWQ